MSVLEAIQRKRQRTEDPGVPVVPVVPVVVHAVPVAPRQVPPIEVVDVEAEPETASPSVAPPITEPTREEFSSPPRTKVGSKSSGKGKEPLGLDGPPLVIFPEIPEGKRDEEYQ